MYVLNNKKNFYSLCNNPDMNRLGVVVSKKFSKSSVKRNRVKRLIKEIYRLKEESLDDGKSIVVLWKSKAQYEDATFKNIESDMNKCFKKACLLKKEEFNA